MTDRHRRAELSHFLRGRRARLRPAQVGLPGGGRRRGAGLRREELAALAGVSVTWYTWLEQGRAIQVSTAVLDSLARALRLSADEAQYLHALAGPDSTLELSDPPVSPVLQALLDSLDLSPAFVMGPCWDILAWNGAAAYVFGDFGAMPASARNVVWLVCTGSSLCRFVRDPDAHLRRVLAEFRSSIAAYLEDARVQQLIARLSAQSPAFCELWQEHDVRGRSAGQKTLVHPEAGPLCFTYTTLQVVDAPTLRLVIYTPDAETQIALRQRLAPAEQQLSP